MKTFNIVVNACIALSVALISPAIYAGPGDLDPTFGNGGKVVLSTSAVYKGVRQFSDGDLLVFGMGNRIVAKRLNSDGTIDYSYGYAGVLSTYAIFDPTVPGSPRDIEILPDGRLIVVGRVKVNPTDADYKPAMWRFDQYGTLDQSFGTDGRLLLATTAGVATEVEEHGGKLFVIFTRSSGMYLSRRFVSGAIDISYGAFGLAQLSPYPYEYETDLKLNVSDGKQYAIRDGSMKRYNYDGSLDTVFGLFGTALKPAYNSCEGTEDATFYGFSEMNFAPGGKLVVSGYASTDLIGVFRNVPGSTRLNLTGTVDSTFNGGTIVCSGGALAPAPSAAYAQTDGKVVVATYNNATAPLTRLLSNGDLDTSYAVVAGDTPKDMLLQAADGKAVVLYPDQIHRRLP